jgi:hypothetical protein
MPHTMEAWVEGVSWVLLASNVRTNASCWLSNPGRDERTHGCSAKLPSLSVCLVLSKARSAKLHVLVWLSGLVQGLLAPRCTFLSVVCLVLSRAPKCKVAVLVSAVWSCPGPPGAKVHVLVCLSGPVQGPEAPRCRSCLSVWSCPGPPGAKVHVLVCLSGLVQGPEAPSCRSCLSVWSFPGPPGAKVHVLVWLSGPPKFFRRPRNPPNPHATSTLLSSTLCHDLHCQATYTTPKGAICQREPISVFRKAYASLSLPMTFGSEPGLPQVR